MTEDEVDTATQGSRSKTRTMMLVMRVDRAGWRRKDGPDVVAVSAHPETQAAMCELRDRLNELLERFDQTYVVMSTSDDFRFEVVDVVDVEAALQPSVPALPGDAERPPSPETPAVVAPLAGKKIFKVALDLEYLGVSERKMSAPRIFWVVGARDSRHAMGSVRDLLSTPDFATVEDDEVCQQVPVSGVSWGDVSRERVVESSANLTSFLIMLGK